MLKMAGTHLGLKDAILLDEGSDVRLEVFNEDFNQWQKLVGRKREQVRAIFLYTTEST
jgi:hypothetical protein